MLTDIWNRITGRRAIYPLLAPIVAANEALKTHRPDIWEIIRDMPVSEALRKACRMLGIQECPKNAPISDAYRIVEAAQGSDV